MLKERIEKRLTDLGLNQFEAAEKAGRNKHYLYDFLNDKKKSIKGEGSRQVANALECSIDYLMGLSDDVGMPPDPHLTGLDEHLDPHYRPNKGDGSTGSVPIVGVVETDVFRRPSAMPKPTDSLVPIEPDPRYSAEAQSAYLLRGPSLKDIGMTDGAILQAVSLRAHNSAGKLRSGAVVISRFSTGSGDQIELSAREYRETDSGYKLIARDSSSEFDVIAVNSNQLFRAGRKTTPDTKLEIEAVVIKAILII